MSSALRLSIIMVLLLAATALGLIAYNMSRPEAPVAVAEKAPAPAAAPATVGYFVAARPLPKGTLTREDDFTVRQAPPEGAPAGAILDTPETKIGLPGSLVRKFVDAGSPITLQDILRPRDRGFLASVLAPDSRAISIKVDEETGVSGLIRPGDNVDVVLTQVFEKADPARRAVSETVLSNVRVIAIDQEIAQGGRPIGNAVNNAVAAKSAQTVSLELAPDQVKKITVAKQLGTLSLVVRAAADQWNKADNGDISSCDVSPELARQSAIAGQSTTIAIYNSGGVKQYSVRKDDSDEGDVLVACDGSSETSRGTTTAMRDASKLPEKR
ncbi:MULTISPECIES: Flp pilus assembly protein CpaB [unclassified Bradyrhizobium]|uniref:Flp pilus assembly protein CpaB n=1 Tax=unclassified Bradyrhizobium TaxID=2631580 RepID=UPI00247B075F|nr:MULTISPECIES: Flp pilus assembly protein CpaB [unclassified Bradyrhizobium]WGS22802.1 Flp pilus assembly protein CpaB [Bradyrhizobium sp. ISRA463]WGS29795.1 Flp pilus assembly protein CpaB [Bradyrhizobium sp. ISRA464]